MRFTPQFLDELKARLPVSEVVGRRVKLQKAGREWKGLSPFNKEKTAVVLRQRPEAGVVRLLLRQERQHLRLRHADRGRHVSRSGRAARADGRRAAAEVSPRRRRRATRSARPCTTSWSLRRNSSRRRSPGAAAPRRAAISPTAALDAATQLKFRLGYAPGERFALKEHLGGQGVSVEDMVEAGLLIAGRRHPGALRPLPRPRDVSDHRLPRPHHRVRRPRARSGRAGEISQLAGDAALSQGLEPLQRRGRAPGGARRRVADRGRGLCRRDRHGARPAIRRRSRRSAPRSPRTSSACSGRWPTSRSSASTATRPAGAPPIARSTWRCRG